MVDYKREDYNRDDKKLDAEGVVVAVVCGLELQIHQVDGGVRGTNKENFHRRVIHRYEVAEEIQVTGCVGQGE